MLFRSAAVACTAMVLSGIMFSDWHKVHVARPQSDLIHSTMETSATAISFTVDLDEPGVEELSLRGDYKRSLKSEAEITPTVFVSMGTAAPVKKSSSFYTGSLTSVSSKALTIASLRSQPNSTSKLQILPSKSRSVISMSRPTSSKLQTTTTNSRKMDDEAHSEKAKREIGRAHV